MNTLWIPPEETARREAARPKHISVRPVHPYLEQELPRTGLFGAWCGRPLWDDDSVDTIQAALMGAAAAKNLIASTPLCRPCVEAVKLALSAAREP